MKNVQIETWTDFESVLDEHTADAQYGRFLFRGQTEDWPVLPSLARRIEFAAEETAVHIESNTHHFFMANAHDHLPDNQYLYLRSGNHPILWWTVMQHHGCPTRLVDWTSSPYAGLYFACNGSTSKDGVVLLFDSVRLFDVMAQEHGKDSGSYTISGQDYFKAFKEAMRTPEPPESGMSPQGKDGLIDPPVQVPHLVSTVVARFADTRITAQQGAFTLSNRVISDHWKVISDTLGDEAVKVTVPSHLKARFMPRLRTMNIHGLSLFPDLTGLSRYALEKAWFPNLSRSQTDPS